MSLGWVSVRRFVWILRVTARHFLGHRLASWLARRTHRWDWLRRRLSTAALAPPDRLRVYFEDLGGTFIKFGQMLALQPDLIPLAYCNALFKLLDQVDPFDYAHVERTFREELGRSPDEIFDSVEREPLATASVGQVHVAWLAGRKVAVKVQRPNVEAEFWADIRLMTRTMSTIRRLRLKPCYWMLEPMGEFVAWTREELDYRNEARYSEELRRHSATSRIQVVPAVHTELTTRRTLVADFLEGTTLLGYLRARERGDEVLLRRLEGTGFVPARFAGNVIDNFLGDAFRYGIYHADLHPANLMILPDSVVGYLDFGITGVLSPYGRRHLMRMTMGLAQGDMQALHDSFLLVTEHGPQSDLEGFRAGLDRLSTGWYEEGPDGQRLLTATFTRIMTEMLRLSRATDVMPERDIIKYIRSSIALDGLITRLAPGFDLGQYLVETCGRYIRWSMRRERFTAETLLAWGSASGQLLADGPVRGAAFLDRLVAERTHGPMPPAAWDDDDERSAARRALPLGVAALAAAALMAVSPGANAPGFNLWTAELAFVVAALALLVRDRLGAGRGAVADELAAGGRPRTTIDHERGWATLAHTWRPAPPPGSAEGGHA